MGTFNDYVDMKGRSNISTFFMFRIKNVNIEARRLVGVKSLVSRFIEGYSFWGIRGPKV